MSCTSATTGSAETKLTLANLKQTLEKLRGIPPAKWMLVSPNGQVWSDEDPMVLAGICARAKFEVLFKTPTQENHD